MHELYTTLSELVSEKKAIAHNVVCTTSCPLEDYFFGRNSLALRMYSICTLAKRGKSRQPMVSYDPDLQVMLNNGRYFTVDIGKYWDKQRTLALTNIMNNELGVLLFTNRYGVREAKQRARLWTLSYSYVDGLLRCRAVFGECYIMPMLPYEVVAIATITQWFAEQIGARKTEITWFFHELRNALPMEFSSPADTKGLTKVPAPIDVSELLRMESRIREDRPKVNPIPLTPLPEELEEIQNDTFTKFCT